MKTDNLDELLGFVTGNNNRQKLLQILGSKGSMDAERIGKLMHVVRTSVDKTLEELHEKGLVEKQGESYQLTETGTFVERELHNF
ncbi:helix-turn-helix domain-containing protein [Methanohalobium sp.]|uniref:helix-turn-helix domain-containing protein n=1 Tax=Methanohalobium sp. TaxID=2837493 RepID=UPI0025E92B47|nr:helix-turn-helix domain-containing protein [Methanohalobium sp.]